MKNEDQTPHCLELPLRYSDHAIDGWHMSVVEDIEGCTVCAPMRPEWARFIVRATNSHAQLVEALEGLLRCYLPYQIEQAKLLGRGNPICQAVKAVEDAKLPFGPFIPMVADVEG